MAVEKIKKHLTRSEAANQLAQVVQQLRDGRVSIGRKVKRLPASDEVELRAELEEDSLRVELRWEA